MPSESMLRIAFDSLAILACSVYCTIPLFWLVLHPFVDSWRKHGRGAYFWILPIWGVFIAVAFLCAWPFHGARLYATWWAWAPAAVLFVLGLRTYSAAFRGFA